MKIDVRLHAVLRDLLPGGRGEVELAGQTVKDLLDTLGIDEELRELITVNGEQIADQLQELHDGDKVEVFPAVAGGERRSPYLEEGIRLFQRGEYFMAHETLEEHWIEAPEQDRDFYQGLIHLAVAFHHDQRGNPRGARSQFRKAAARLSSYPDVHEGVDLAGIRRFLAEADERLEAGDPLDPPAIELWGGRI